MANVTVNAPTLNPITAGVEGIYKWNAKTITYKFASQEDEDIILSDFILQGSESLQYLDTETGLVNAIKNALAAYARVIDVEFVEADSFAEADMKFVGLDNFEYLGFGQFPGMNYNQHVGGFESYMFVNTSFPFPHAETGGAGFYEYLALHELGHMTGLGHPHDNGNGSLFWAHPSITPFDDKLDNARYTVMSYEAGGEDTVSGAPYGHVLTPSAIDIAALQSMYGANMKTHKGNTVYKLTDAMTAPTDVNGEDGTVSIGRAYYTIWDAGGRDTITYDGAHNVYINLNAATLTKSYSDDIVDMIDAAFDAPQFYNLPGLLQQDIINSDYHAGGFFSRIYHSSNAYQIGGYAIAKGVTIENASGSGGNDVLIGNAAANVLRGKGGDDFLYGGKSRDALFGGNGNDTLFGGHGRDRVFGGNGNDFIDGDEGVDRLSGGRGDDIFYDRDEGRDFYQGGTGFDVVLLTESEGPAFVDLRQRQATSYGDHFHSIEGVGGTHYDDVLIGDHRDNLLGGLDGDDVMIGGRGLDTLSGGEGDDFFIDDDMQADIYFGGEGFDSLFFTDTAAPLTLNLLDGMTNFGDEVSEIERFYGTAFDDNFIAGTESHTFTGGLGSDIFAFADVTTSVLTARDRVTDFETGTDIIGLFFEAELADLNIQATNGYYELTVAETDFNLRVDQAVALSDVFIVPPVV